MSALQFNQILQKFSPESQTRCLAIPFQPVASHYFNQFGNNEDCKIVA